MHLIGFIISIYHDARSSESQIIILRMPYFTAHTLYWGYGLSFGVLNSMDGTDGCPETSVRNYHYSLCNNPEERSSY